MSTPSTLPTVAEMERAYLERDATYDGLFYLGVRTTGIFCRPTCPARKPLAKNVEYFATPNSAIAAGYRPCKRCRPMQLDDEPLWATRLIDEVEREPAARISEGDLAARGVDPATVRRYFQRRYGMTFQAYTRARRLGGALHLIREDLPVDAAVFESGYDSHSGFRDAFARTFGSTPRGAQDCIYLSWLKSPLGPLVAGATAEGVCLVEFTDRRMLATELAELRRHFGAVAIPGTNDHLRRLKSELKAYFAGTLRKFSVPLSSPGTTFQQRVWDRLVRIPYGQTRSYDEIAAALGQPGAQRAVGRANGMNRIAIVIPCHRVVRKGGQLGGYGGGLRRKQFLLELEKRNSEASHVA
jgi:AraC family transcriptional regulator of adaptative response/methylated-DNA-[protein]-cysteine methyltransferase